MVDTKHAAGIDCSSPCTELNCIACRVLIAPNVHDASPRVLAEAMSLDVPILVNKYIVGGWKYVNEDTGAFFESADNVVPAFKEIMSRMQQGKLRPREWFK